MKRKTIIASIPALALLLVPGLASAHVIVTPAQAGVGEELTFNVSVPNERQVAVTSVKLAIPSGVGEVTPTHEDGWTITTTKKGDDVNAITWAAGTIPVGEREDFSFSAQVPGSATNLDWKAYQTYADGTLVHWDQTPNGKSDDSVGNAGPFSVTKVVNDLNASTNTSTNTTNTLLLTISLIALVIAIIALLRKP